MCLLNKGTWSIIFREHGIFLDYLREQWTLARVFLGNKGETDITKGSRTPGTKERRFPREALVTVLTQKPLLAVSVLFCNKMYATTRKMKGTVTPCLHDT